MHSRGEEEEGGGSLIAVRLSKFSCIPKKYAYESEATEPNKKVSGCWRYKDRCRLCQCPGLRRNILAQVEVRVFTYDPETFASNAGFVVPPLSRGRCDQTTPRCDNSSE
ncbi:hypothetical protein EVAR_86655_1 [Eumeta japonica]|uniref:Uncharacterized protein n=1 Tax=Eumeta variegata TaxID=151549 RepID=A0A4C1Z843_EUMVA|nr:hypothetical protein EVAR_86655_1 [Eumeta japonica]